jgi:signal transduction histidine kinase
MMSQTIRTLLIEDDSDDYLLTCDMLEDVPDIHFDVTRGRTYEDGLNALLTGKFDIALVDYQLGAHTGLEVLKKAMAAGVITPMILFTGQGDEGLAVTALKEGALDYLVKGRVTSKALDRAIHNAMEKHRLTRQLAAQQHQLAEQKVELEIANAELARKNADIQSFQHTVSHELKNPLAAAQEFASILQEGLAGELTEDQLTYVGIIRDNCAQMGTMINDLLDASRIENGKLTLMPELLPVETLIPGIVQAMTPTARAAGITPTWHLDPDLPPVEADPARIRQLLTNLIANGIKFTPEGGNIVVSVTTVDEHLCIAVEDTGVGIPSENLDLIFSRFFQSNDQRDQAKGGLGLGLAICKGIVDLHNGQIIVESELGKGSRFSCLLPIAPVAKPLL